MFNNENGNIFSKNKIESTGQVNPISNKFIAAIRSNEVCKLCEPIPAVTIPTTKTPTEFATRKFVKTKSKNKIKKEVKTKKLYMEHKLNMIFMQYD